MPDPLDHRHIPGESALSPTINVRGPEALEMDVAVDPPLANDGLIEVQESADTVDWVSHPVPAWTGQAGTVRLPEDPARRFVRVRLPELVPGWHPRRVRCRVRRRYRRSEEERD